MGKIKNYDEKGKTGLPMSDWGVTEDIKLKSWGFTTGAGVGLNLGKNLQLTFRYDYISPLDPPTSSRTLTYFAIPIEPIFNAKGVYGVGLTVLGF
jgi:opacity protein-like surface antigen